jgi:serine/threonine protein kinase
MSNSPPTRARKSCSRCGQPLREDAVLGACPHCLLAAGFTSEPAASADAAPPAIGELAPEFPQLELLELLGRGGMGAVYKARQRSLDRLVALKLLRPGLDVDPTFAERFAREARALAGLNHPGIVTLYEFGRTPGGLFFILMEFVDGVNLRQLLAAGRLAPREALAIIPPLCDALQYAHDRGLVHRDIKPENILVDRIGRVKVADFGLAKLADQPDRAFDASGEPGAGSPSLGDFNFELSEAGKVMGTPRYMAPEQRERPAEVDHRADIYALGVVLYQMLTGELPDAKQLQPPSRRVTLDVRLDQIVLRALEQQPSLRFQNATAMKTEIEHANESPVPTRSGDDSLGQRTSRFMEHSHEQASKKIAQIKRLPRELVVVAGVFVVTPYFSVWASSLSFVMAVVISVGLLLLLPVARTAAFVYLCCQIFFAVFYLSPARRVLNEHLNQQFGINIAVSAYPKTSDLLAAWVVILTSILIWSMLRSSAIIGLFSPARSQPRSWIHSVMAIGASMAAAWISFPMAIGGFVLVVGMFFGGHSLTAKNGSFEDRAVLLQKMRALPSVPPPEAATGASALGEKATSLTDPRLQFRRVLKSEESGSSQLSFGSEALILSGAVLLDEKALSDVTFQDNGAGSGPAIREIQLRLTPAGAKRFEEISRILTGERLAILFDGRALVAPRVNGVISSGTVQITGRFTVEEIETLANTLRSAAGLPLLQQEAKAAVTVNVFGAVSHPGNFQMTPGSTLLDVLGAAEGWKPAADLRKVAIMHRENVGKETPPTSHDVDSILKGGAANPAVRDGDTVFVPQHTF